MINPILERELHSHLENLDPRRQQEVLEFAQSLVIRRSRGVPGRELLHFAGALSPEEAHEMMEAIDEDCGKVDLSAW